MTASIAALNTALQTAHKVHSIVNGVNNAPSELEALQRETQDVQGPLMNCIELLQTSSGDLQRAEEVQALTEEARGLIETAQDLMDQALSELDETREVKMSVWLSYSHRVSTLAKDFKSLTRSLTGILAAYDKYDRLFTRMILADLSFSVTFSDEAQALGFGLLNTTRCATRSGADREQDSDNRTVRDAGLDADVLFGESTDIPYEAVSSSLAPSHRHCLF